MVTKFPRFELVQISWLILHNQRALTKFRRGLQYSGTPPYRYLSDTITSLLQPLFFWPSKMAKHFLIKKPLMQSPVNTATSHILKSQTVNSLTMCDSRKYPYPSTELFFRLDHPPPRNFCSRGVMYDPPPPRNFLCPFHGLNLPYLEIIDRVPLKINCSHLKTQFFVIFYKAIMYSLLR